MTKTQNIIAQIDKNVKTKQWSCLAENCEEVAINSHLIQQNGLLSNIVENGHLIELKMLDAYKWGKNLPPFYFQRVGITQALSHKIFCNKHDTEIFRNIESVDSDFESYEAFLLFSYRAVCAEIRKKEIVIEKHNRLINANTLDGIIDKDTLRGIQNGHALGIKDLNILKQILVEELSDNKNKFNYFSYKYAKQDIYASAVFSATDILIPREDGDLDLENIYIHILPLSSETLLLVGYHNDYTSKATTDYCNSWKELSLEDLQTKLTSLICNNIENWGISIEKYNTLSEGNKRRYVNILKENSNYFGISKESEFNMFKE